MGTMPSSSRSQLVLASLILFVLKCVSNTQAEVNKALENPFTLNDIDSETDTLTDEQQNPLFSKEELDKVSDVLAKLLLIPWPKGESPLLYVEKPAPVQEYLENAPYENPHRNALDNENGFRPTGSKRSKYYRKYPWKRQQNSMRYEPAYMCLPNKDDVYRLLVAIHGERDGYKGQLVEFCNRKRPASLVFTNIRYVG